MKTVHCGLVVPRLFPPSHFARTQQASDLEMICRFVRIVPIASSRFVHIFTVNTRAIWISELRYWSSLFFSSPGLPLKELYVYLSDVYCI